MIMPRISILMYVVMALFQCPRTAARVAAGGQLQSGGGFRIAGRVVNAKAGTPLERARVSITDTKNPQRSLSVLTSDEGQFQFNGLPAGKFALEGAKRGFIRAAYDHHDQFSTAIVTGAGLDTESLILRLDPVAVLSGKILDEAGDPVRPMVIEWEDLASAPPSLAADHPAGHVSLDRVEVGDPLRAIGSWLPRIDHVALSASNPPGATRMASVLEAAMTASDADAACTAALAAPPPPTPGVIVRLPPPH